MESLPATRAHSIASSIAVSAASSRQRSLSAMEIESDPLSPACSPEQFCVDLRNDDDEVLPVRSAHHAAADSSGLPSAVTMVNPSPLLSTSDAFLFDNASLISLLRTHLSLPRSFTDAASSSFTGQHVRTPSDDFSARHPHDTRNCETELSSVMYPPALSYPPLTRAYPAHAPLSVMPSSEPAPFKYLEFVSRPPHVHLQISGRRRVLCWMLRSSCPRLHCPSRTYG